MKDKKIFCGALVAMAFVVTFVSCNNPMISVNAAQAAAPSVELVAQTESYAVGASSKLTAVAFVSDGGSLSYQWYKGEEAIAGATGKTYLSKETAAAAYAYSVLVTNTLGSSTNSTKSDSVTITVTAAPSGNADNPNTPPRIIRTVRMKVQQQTLLR